MRVHDIGFCAALITPLPSAVAITPWSNEYEAIWLSGAPWGSGSEVKDTFCSTLRDTQTGTTNYSSAFDPGRAFWLHNGRHPARHYPV
jgi:hypothetical protein